MTVGEGRSGRSNRETYMTGERDGELKGLVDDRTRSSEEKNRYRGSE